MKNSDQENEAKLFIEWLESIGSIVNGNFIPDSSRRAVSYEQFKQEKIMLDPILKSIAPPSGIIPHVKNMAPDDRYELFALVSASGDSECIAHLMEKLIGDHALSQFIASRAYNHVAQNIAAMAFESAIFAALEAPIQDAIDRYNSETLQIQSLTGDPLIDSGHKQTDFS
jgi:hypothetical protein